MTSWAGELSLHDFDVAIARESTHLYIRSKHHPLSRFWVIGQNEEHARDRRSELCWSVLESQEDRAERIHLNKPVKVKYGCPYSATCTSVSCELRHNAT